MEANDWLEYFAGRAINAQEIAREEVDFVLAKIRFYEAYGDHLNDRQYLQRFDCGLEFISNSPNESVIAELMRTYPCDHQECSE
ncbi:MAG: hypothetical protein AB2672_11605 [Candidatus Thiodiazotropha endolucinida]|nr:hypothetical protein [Candidatus Thiodiazotropha sp. (ex Lucina pensylvanica)]MCG7879633.1 hypothetical protein [Candidatus Thiodiazotropha taylori]MCG8095152.1 hypothetical protein [Candidatus Thiodiazotropha endolucinida]MCG7880095.1 hypothetical protein [Candidatus Thiodiazotropha taylori]MCG7887948.1 hypothetical protein [Candidatus Thiodiazotropha taylori]